MISGFLSQQFSFNVGAAYRYAHNMAASRFEDSPAPVQSAFDHVKELIPGFKMNELLILGYLKGQKMNFHSDDENGLGPTVVSWSFGSSAEMCFRERPPSSRRTLPTEEELTRVVDPTCVVVPYKPDTLPSPTPSSTKIIIPQDEQLHQQFHQQPSLNQPSPSNKLTNDNQQKPSAPIQQSLPNPIPEPLLKPIPESFQKSFLPLSSILHSKQVDMQKSESSQTNISTNLIPNIPFPQRIIPSQQPYSWIANIPFTTFTPLSETKVISPLNCLGTRVCSPVWRCIQPPPLASSLMFPKLDASPVPFLENISHLFPLNLAGISVPPQALPLLPPSVFTSLTNDVSINTAPATAAASVKQTPWKVTPLESGKVGKPISIPKSREPMRSQERPHRKGRGGGGGGSVRGRGGSGRYGGYVDGKRKQRDDFVGVGLYPLDRAKKPKVAGVKAKVKEDVVIDAPSSVVSLEKGIMEELIEVEEGEVASNSRPEEMERKEEARDKKRSEMNRVCLKLLLQHGDLLIMDGASVQHFYEHSIKPVDNIRFVVTARRID
ncbi:UNVERIFIED_CONTAM: hypothetical protein HDU68_009086 [Siphonaria sp. JEL0065]|nr:hypothetical protein HDU68_009086 [Siphonaria sp. JEL0065]